MQHGTSTEISRERATKAGRIIANAPLDSPEFKEALQITQQWRAQHLEATVITFQHLVNLLDVADEVIISCRLKRLSSIVNKLRRSQTDLKLGALDDIGGCRVITSDMRTLNVVAEKIRNSFQFKAGSKEKNYIVQTPPSGYRSIHFLTKETSGNKQYRVEIQLRTQLQHEWASMVEAVGYVYEKDYKTPAKETQPDSRDQEILKYLKVFSQAVAYKEELEAAGEHYDYSKNPAIAKMVEMGIGSRISVDLLTCDDGLLFGDPTSVDHNTLVFSSNSERQTVEVSDTELKNVDTLIEKYNTLEIDDNTSDIVMISLKNASKLRDAYSGYTGKYDISVKTLLEYFCDPQISGALPGN